MHSSMGLIKVLQTLLVVKLDIQMLRISYLTSHHKAETFWDAGLECNLSHIAALTIASARHQTTTPLA